MPENAKNEEATSATEIQQDVAQASDAKAEAAGTAKASDELSEDDLEAVAGGRKYDLPPRGSQGDRGVPHKP